MKSNRMRLLAALFLLPLAVVAQQVVESPSISARFRVLAFSEPIDGGYTLKKGWSPLLITSDFLTAEQSYRGPAALTILRKTVTGSTQPLASTQLTDGAKLILLLTPDGNGGQRIVQIDDAPGAFPYGSVRFFNLTGKPLGLRINSRSLVIATGEESVVKPSPDTRGYAAMQLMTQKDGEWGVGYNLRIFSQEDVRTIYFVLPGPADSHGVALKGVEERQTSKSPAESTPGSKPAEAPAQPEDN